MKIKITGCMPPIYTCTAFSFMHIIIYYNSFTIILYNYIYLRSFIKDEILLWFEKCVEFQNNTIIMMGIIHCLLSIRIVCRHSDKSVLINM